MREILHSPKSSEIRKALTAACKEANAASRADGLRVDVKGTTRRVLQSKEGVKRWCAERNDIADTERRLVIAWWTNPIDNQKLVLVGGNAFDTPPSHRRPTDDPYSESWAAPAPPCPFEVLFPNETREAERRAAEETRDILAVYFEKDEFITGFPAEAGRAAIVAHDDEAALVTHIGAWLYLRGYVPQRVSSEWSRPKNPLTLAERLCGAKVEALEVLAAGYRRGRAVETNLGTFRVEDKDDYRAAQLELRAAALKA
jgi:hypothetical protein